MKFKDILTNKEIVETVNENIIKIIESKTPEDILRDNNFKIKSVHPTKFGTEYVMAKKYDEEDIKNVLNNFKIKFDENSIFVIA